MLCNYDTDFFMESIVSVQGRRYNSSYSTLNDTDKSAKKEDLDKSSDNKAEEKKVPNKDNQETLIGRNISKDDVAGFFRTLMLVEEHKSVIKVINQLQIADAFMITSALGLKYNTVRKLIESCILCGLIYENRIKTEKREYFWYMLDTGGLYALEDMEVNPNILPFTLPIEQKYKLYLKSQFIFNTIGYFSMTGLYSVKDKNGKVYNVELLEDVKQVKIHDYKSTIFLVNLETLNHLKINSFVKKIAKSLSRNGNKFFDINLNQFLEITD